MVCVLWFVFVFGVLRWGLGFGVCVSCFVFWVRVLGFGVCVQGLGLEFGSGSSHSVSGSG